MTNIVLVGVPGAGKTTVGRLLADQLGREFLDTDVEIERQTGKTVSEIFTEDGEATFRSLEAETIASALADTNQVVSLGGGALLNEQTRALVAKQTAIWLVASLASAVARVGLNRNRPLLLGNVRGQLSDLMLAREPLYREVAKIEIETSALSPEQVVAEIIKKLDLEGPDGSN
ncbi:MAG: shikimate kinase [Actinomycetales bacterium]|nr:shikimate kinase [Actinomycetales bacterium]